MTQDSTVDSDLSVNTARRAQRTPLGLFAATYVFVSLVAFSPVVNYQAWTPKAALLPLLIAAGAPLLFLLVRQPEHRLASIAAIFFVVVAAVSTVLSPHPGIAAFGLYGWGTGFVFCVALVCAWALGRVLDERARTDVSVALVAGFTINLAVAIAQRFFDLSSFRLELTHERSSGLLGNPVNLGALAGAVLAIALVGWARPRLGPWVLAALAGGALLQLAGGRVGLLVLAVAVVYSAVRQGLPSAAIGLLAVFAGMALATPVSSLSGIATTERLDTGIRSEGVASRLENWSSALGAVAERPVLGTGPGTYLAATSDRRTTKLGMLDGGDNVYADAHNLAVEYAVTTGILGFGSLLLFVILASRGAGGPLLAVALALGVSHLLQPQNVGLTPLMLLALGAAGSGSAMGHRKPSRLPWIALAPLGAVASAMFLFADHQLRQSSLDFTQSQALTAERVLPKWKDPASLISRNYLFRAITENDETFYAEAERWRRVAAEREPYDSYTWYRLGEIQLRRLRFVAAEESFKRALQENPTTVNGRVGLGQVAVANGDVQSGLQWYREALQFTNSPSTVDQIEQLIDAAG